MNPIDLWCRCGTAGCDAPRQADPRLVAALQMVEAFLARPLVVTSGNRCAKWNAAVGGESLSEHVQYGGCLAVDLACTRSRDRALLMHACRGAGLSRFVLYPRHVHVGIGDRVDPTHFPSEVVALGAYPPTPPKEVA